MIKTCAGLAMVTSWSWMVSARTSFVIVRIPVRNRSGLTLRSVGPDNMLHPVPFGVKGWRAVCRRVRRFFSVPLTELVENGVFLGKPCAYGGTRLASLHPHMYKAWVTQMCLPLDTPIGRRSVGALSP